MSHRDMKKRFNHHHAQRLDAPESATKNQGNDENSSSDRASSVAALSLPSPRLSGSDASPRAGDHKSGGTKRVMSMSQLRVAASRAGLQSPLRQLVVAKSPLARRIRSDILSGGGSGGGGSNVNSGARGKADAVHSPLPSGGSNNNNKKSPRTAPSSSARRQRLHEARFRRPSAGSSPKLPAAAESSAKREGAASSSALPSLLKTPNNPLSRYAICPSSFFTPPLALAASRESSIATTERKAGKAPDDSREAPAVPSGKETIITTPNVKPDDDSQKEAITPTLPPSRSLARTPSAYKPRRIASSRSPLQALMGASNGGPRASCSTQDPGAKGPPRALPAVNEAIGAPAKDADTATTRRNLDKRTARLWFGPKFASEIARLVAQPAAAPHFSSVGAGNVTVAIRKRPQFPYEASRGDFDVVAMGDNYCTVYKTTMQADMRTAVVAPITYPCSVALDERSTNPQVYRAVLKPLVTAATQYPPAARSPPPSAALLHFGQTGSGKSFTMAGLERELVDDLLYPVSVQYVELSGKSCRDLLESQREDASRSSSTVRVLNSSVVGAAWVSARNPDELLRLLAVAKSHRATKATDRNHESSRSHAVVTLRLEGNGACLTLVDCAGTEGSYDSMYHSKDRLAETADINWSLFSLNQCIRARATLSSSASHGKSVAVPYRSSTLTSLLRPHLESGGPLVVVATVSPNATDTELTLGTLKTVATLLGTTCHEGSPKVVATEPRPGSQSPKAWNHEDLVRFLESKRLLEPPKHRSESKHPFDPVVVPPTLNGRQLMRMNKIQIANALRTSTEVAAKVYDLLRAETTRVARLELKQRIQAKAR